MTRTRLTADINSAFHLPDKHNQKSHGNRAGKKDNVPSKTSKHAPEGKKKSTSTELMTEAEFESRASNAARGEDVFAQLVINDDVSSVEDLIASGKLSGVSTADARNAYLDYTAGGYEIINGQLRKTNDVNDLDDDKATTVKTLDKMMNASQLGGDIIVQRGIRDPRTMFGDAFVNDRVPNSNRGLTWVDNGFASTTVSSEMADEFGRDVIMNILVPKGMRATGAPWSKFPIEREVILPRGTKYRVVSSYRAQGTGRTTFNVEIIS